MADTRSIRQGGWLHTTTGSGATYAAAMVAYDEFYIRYTSNPKGDHKSPNNHSLRRTTYVGCTGGESLATGYPSTSYTRHGVLMNAGDVIQDNVGYWMADDAYNTAVSKLYSAMRPDTDLSIDLAQASQVKRMIKSSFKVVSYARDFFGQLKSYPLKAAGSKWLEYQFGWKPLVQEVYDSFQQLMLPSGAGLYFTARAKGKSISEETKVIDMGNWVRVGKVFKSARTEIVATYCPSASRMRGLGNYTSLNPASIAWELVPYSFVVDWFYNIGGYLRALESAALWGDAFVSGYRTEGTLVTVSEQQSSTGKYPGGEYLRSASGSFRDATKDRMVLYKSPMPRPPVLAPKLGAVRLTHAASLLSQFMGRGI